MKGAMIGITVRIDTDTNDLQPGIRGPIHVFETRNSDDTKCRNSGIGGALARRDYVAFVGFGSDAPQPVRRAQSHAVADLYIREAQPIEGSGENFGVAGRKLEVDAIAPVTKSRIQNAERSPFHCILGRAQC
jgi:hypothetical protein